MIVASIWLCAPQKLIGQNDVSMADGNIVLANVLETVYRQASISARIRHQARLFDHKLVGNGTYFQQATEALPLSRWEMNTQIAGKTASFTQIYDGQYLWTDRRFPSGRQIHRLEVALLHSRMKEAESGRLRLSVFKEGQGGLSQMIAETIQNFDFERPRSTQLEGSPALALLGTWKEDSLRRLWPAAAKREGKEGISWPDHLPHHVLVLVGQNMFPYVLEHRRYEDHLLASSASGLRRVADPLLRYELYEVEFAVALQKKTFEFLETEGWKDETSLVAERLTQ